MEAKAEARAQESQARRRGEIEHEVDEFLAALRRYLLLLADRVGARPEDPE